MRGRVGANELRSFQRQRQDLFGEMEQKRPAFLLCGGLEMYSRPAENSVLRCAQSKVGKITKILRSFVIASLWLHATLTR